MYRMLVVDDEKIERDGVCFLVEKYSYPFEIVQKSNGKEAEDYLKENKVDLLLSDIKMPFMDGLELCAAARMLYPGLKIVLLTAYNDFEYTKKAIMVKVDDYIMKPVIVADFCSLMENIVEDLDKREQAAKRRKRMLSSYRTAQGAIKEKLFEEIVAEINLALGSESTELLSTDTGQQDNLSDKFVIKKALEIIDKEYTTDIHPAEIAQRLNFSRGYLSTMFRNETGLSLMQYLTMVKMNMAQKLLIESAMKVNEIAAAVGYNDISYFGMVFKKTFGMTPAKFRNNGAGVKTEQSQEE